MNINLIEKIKDQIENIKNDKSVFKNKLKILSIYLLFIIIPLIISSLKMNEGKMLLIILPTIFFSLIFAYFVFFLGLIGSMLSSLSYKLVRQIMLFSFFPILVSLSTLYPLEAILGYELAFTSWYVFSSVALVISYLFFLFSLKIIKELSYLISALISLTIYSLFIIFLYGMYIFLSWQ